MWKFLKILVKKKKKNRSFTNKNGPKKFRGENPEIPVPGGQITLSIFASVLAFDLTANVDVFGGAGRKLAYANVSLLRPLTRQNSGAKKT